MNSQPILTGGSANARCFSEYLSGQSSAASFVILKSLRGTESDGCTENSRAPASVTHRRAREYVFIRQRIEVREHIDTD